MSKSWYKILLSGYQVVMSVCMFLYYSLKIEWNKDLRISTCRNQDRKKLYTVLSIYLSIYSYIYIYICIVILWDAELLKLYFLWIWVLHCPTTPPGTNVFTFLHCLQSLTIHTTDCASVSPELLLAQETGRSWLTSNQQKWCHRASCCSFSCHGGTPFNPLPVSSCQCLQNLQEFNYLQGFYLSIKLDWNKSMNLQMVKGEKVWQTAPTYKLHFFGRVSKKLNSGKCEILKSINAWTMVMEQKRINKWIK